MTTLEKLTYTAAATAKLNEKAAKLEALQIGDGVTVVLWTDCEAYTIIKKTPTTMILQQDKATMDPAFKPEFIVGGFAGHCINQNDQTYTYEKNPNGAQTKITLRKWKDEEGQERRKWKQAGVGTFQQGGGAFPGRAKFHDYNF